MMKKTWIVPLLIIIFISSSSLSACGFKLRSPSDISLHLSTLYIDAPNPYDPLVIQISQTLRALNVHLTKTRKVASAVLQITDIEWETVIPSLLCINNATTYSYTLSVNFIVETSDRLKIRRSKNLTLTHSLLQNANQIYTRNATCLMKLEMTRMMAMLIYNYLIVVMSNE